MYEFRAKTPTQYDFMSRVSPCRFEAKSSRKMDSSSPQKGYPFWVPTFYSSLRRCPPSSSSALLSNRERGDPGLAALLMRSCFAWLVITEWFSPLLVEDMFCFLNTNGFFTLTWTRFWLCRRRSMSRAQYRERPLTSHLSICVVMYNYASKFAGQIHLWDTRGGRGDERWMG